MNTEKPNGPKSQKYLLLILKESLPALPLGHQLQVLIQYFCTYLPLWKVTFLKNGVVGREATCHAGMQEMQETRVQSLDQEDPVE